MTDFIGEYHKNNNNKKVNRAPKPRPLCGEIYYYRATPISVYENDCVCAVLDRRTRPRPLYFSPSICRRVACCMFVRVGRSNLSKNN